MEFRALGCDVAVEGQLAALEGSVRALCDSYPPAGAGPLLRYRLTAAPELALFRDDALIFRAVHALDLVSVFEQDLYAQLIDRFPAAWLLHGAALAREQRAVVLAGPSGAGKSTLALALAARGAAYLTDDCAAIDEQGQVQGLARPICFEPGSAPVVPVRAPFRPQRCAVRLLHGAVVESLAVHPPPALRCERAGLLAVVSLRHAPAERPRWRALTAGEALCALWPHSLRRRAGDLERAAAALGQVEAFELVTRDVQQACAAVEALWRDEQVLSYDRPLRQDR